MVDAQHLTLCRPNTFCRQGLGALYDSRYMDKKIFSAVSMEASADDFSISHSLLGQQLPQGRFLAPFAPVDPGIRFLSLKEVQKKTDLSRSTIYNLLNSQCKWFDPCFPQRVQLTSRRVAWPETLINDWLLARMSGQKIA